MILPRPQQSDACRSVFIHRSEQENLRPADHLSAAPAGTFDEILRVIDSLQLITRPPPGGPRAVNWKDGKTCVVVAFDFTDDAG